MQRSLWIGLPAICLLAVACEGAPGPAISPAGPDLHVGYTGPGVPLGFVSNDTECHVGKRGNRWPSSEQWEVKVYDAQLVVAPSGVVTLVCKAQMPPTKPNGDPLLRPKHAEVEKNVLCFLPGGRETRHAQEVFTPAGEAILTCHYNPTGSGNAG
jgi:hypothetical protein